MRQTAAADDGARCDPSTSARTSLVQQAAEALFHQKYKELTKSFDIPLHKPAKPLLRESVIQQTETSTKLSLSECFSRRENQRILREKRLNPQLFKALYSNFSPVPTSSLSDHYLMFDIDLGNNESQYKKGIEMSPLKYYPYGPKNLAAYSIWDAAFACTDMWMPNFSTGEVTVNPRRLYLLPWLTNAQISAAAKLWTDAGNAEPMSVEEILSPGLECARLELARQREEAGLYPLDPEVLIPDPTKEPPWGKHCGAA